MLNNLKKTCLEVFDRFSPLRKLSKRYQKTWITPDIIEMCKKRDSLHAKMVLKKIQLKKILSFRIFKKTVKLAIRRAQRKYHDKKIEDSSSKQMSQVFNNFCGNEKVAQSEVEPNTQNGFFVSIGIHLSESIPSAGSASRHLEKKSF